LRDIENILNNLRKIGTSQDLSNFGLVKYKDKKGELRPAYQISRDGFSLLAMSFTGKKALQWKMLFINAFNEME
ncbi:Cpp32, partial [Campylobacter jejuni subsp. jejuni 2008-988]